MSYIEEIRSNEVNSNSLSHESYDAILKSVVRYRDAIKREITESDKRNIWKLMKEENFHEAKKDLGGLDNTTFDEFVKIMRLVEEYEELYNNPNVGRFSEDPAGVKGEEKVKQITQLTNRASIRQIAREMMQEKDDGLEFINEKNDNIYKCLDELGLGKDKALYVPKAVRDRFETYLKKETLKSDIATAITMSNRFEFYLLQYEKSKSYATDSKSIERILSKEKIENIRSSLGKNEIVLQEIINAKNEKIKQTKGLTPIEILKSDFKQYKGLEVWQELLKERRDVADKLFNEVKLIPQACDFLEKTLGKSKSPNPNTELFLYLWDNSLKRRERNGKDVSEEKKRYLKDLEEYKRAISTKMPLKYPDLRSV